MRLVPTSDRIAVASLDEPVIIELEFIDPVRTISLRILLMKRRNRHAKKNHKTAIGEIPWS